jgi:hypothetical protein
MPAFFSVAAVDCLILRSPFHKQPLASASEMICALPLAPTSACNAGFAQLVFPLHRNLRLVSAIKIVRSCARFSQAALGRISPPDEATFVDWRQPAFGSALVHFTDDRRSAVHVQLRVHFLLITVARFLHNYNLRIAIVTV